MPSFTSDDAFSMTTTTQFYEAKFESRSLPTEIKVWFWAGKQAAWKRNDLMAPWLPRQQLPCPVCKSSGVFSSCRPWGLSKTQPSSCFGCRSALGEGPFPAGGDREACPSSFTWDVETLPEFLVETKVKVKKDFQARMKLLVRLWEGDTVLGQHLRRVLL